MFEFTPFQLFRQRWMSSWKEWFALDSYFSLLLRCWLWNWHILKFCEFFGNDSIVSLELGQLDCLLNFSLASFFGVGPKGYGEFWNESAAKVDINILKNVSIKLSNFQLLFWNQILFPICLDLFVNILCDWFKFVYFKLNIWNHRFPQFWGSVGISSLIFLFHILLLFLWLFVFFESLLFLLFLLKSIETGELFCSDWRVNFGTFWRRMIFFLCAWVESNSDFWANSLKLMSFFAWRVVTESATRGSRCIVSTFARNNTPHTLIAWASAPRGFMWAEWCKLASFLVLVLLV